MCQTTADCTDPRFPTCGTIWVFNGSDAGRAKSVCQPAPGLEVCAAPRAERAERAEAKVAPAAAVPWVRAAAPAAQVVVDGYDRAQGSYTLRVTCTCK